MSSRELRRVEVLSRVKSKELKLVDAAALLEVSYRQAKRLWRRYRCAGAAGLKHRNVGRASPRAKPGAFRQQVLRRVREKYSGEVGQRFGPTLAAEHLASEDGLHIAAETLRRWMLAEGLWRGERERKPHRQRRERKRHFGELVQMDGSFHPWLEERGPEGCLMDMVDDATGTTLGRLGEQETIWAAAHTLRGWIERYQGRFFQLQRASRHYAPAQARVLVCEWPDERWRSNIAGSATAPAQEAQRWTEKSVRGRKYVPPPDHPWRQGYEQRQRAALSEPTPTVVRVAASASP